MIKVSSRFLMILMLAVLATTGMLTTSAFAAGVGRVLGRYVESTLPGIERWSQESWRALGVIATDNAASSGVEVGASSRHRSIKHKHVEPTWP
jgi:hypothetical protein